MTEDRLFLNWLMC